MRVSIEMLVKAHNAAACPPRRIHLFDHLKNSEKQRLRDICAMRSRRLGAACGIRLGSSQIDQTSGDCHIQFMQRP